MIKAHTPVAPGRARTQVHRGRSPSRSRESHAAACSAVRGIARSDGACTGAGSAGTKAILSLAAGLLVAVGLLLLLSSIHAGAVGPWAQNVSASRRAAWPTTETIDPRLILVPRTVTQAATATGVALELTAGPLLPGPNRFELRLVQGGRPLARASILLVARMIGMAMHPITLTMREQRPGQYAAVGPLAMFGTWQLTVQIDRRGTASLRHQFTVSLDLPTGLLTAPATRGAPQR